MTDSTATYTAVLKNCVLIIKNVPCENVPNTVMEGAAERSVYMSRK